MTNTSFLTAFPLVKGFSLFEIRKFENNQDRDFQVAPPNNTLLTNAFVADFTAPTMAPFVNYANPLSRAPQRLDTSPSVPITFILLVLLPILLGGPLVIVSGCIVKNRFRKRRKEAMKAKSRIAVCYYFSFFLSPYLSY